MMTTTERHSEHVRIHGRDPLPGHAAGRAILFTGVHDLAGAFWMSVAVACVTWIGSVLLHGSSLVLEKVFLALVFLGWLYLLRVFLSPFKVLVGLDDVTEWRWNGRHTLPMREAVSTAYGRGHYSLVARRSDALSKGLDRALLTASEWLLATKSGSDYQDQENHRALDTAAPPMVILAVGEDVVPVVGDEVWFDRRVSDGTIWRLAPEQLRAATEGAAIVLVPRRWNDKYCYFEYADPLLLAEPSADAEAIRDRLRALD